VINFPPSYRDEKLLKKAVRWSMRNRFHIPSLSTLAPRRDVAAVTEVGRAWQDAGLGRMIEVSEEGHCTVHFSFNDEAVLVVNKLNRRSLMGRFKMISQSDWIAAGALLVSLIALFK
jgi:hypothetical protein